MTQALMLLLLGHMHLGMLKGAQLIVDRPACGLR